jgi:hypothetical protein
VASENQWRGTRKPGVFDGLELHTRAWQVQPLAVEKVKSSFFDDRSIFPPGSVEFDCALLIRGIEHEWIGRESLCACGREMDGGARSRKRQSKDGVSLACDEPCLGHFTGVGQLADKAHLLRHGSEHVGIKVEDAQGVVRQLHVKHVDV